MAMAACRLTATMALALVGLAPLPVSAQPMEPQSPVMVSRHVTGGATGGPCGTPRFARGNPRWLSFGCRSPLTLDDDNDRADTFLLDRQTGAIDRVSVTSEGAEVRFDSSRGYPSDDGRYVVFMSNGPLHPDAGNIFPGVGRASVYLRDRSVGTTILIARDALGRPRSRSVTLEDALPARHLFAVQTPSRWLADPPDPPIVVPDIYTRHWLTGQVHLVSVSASGGLPDAGAFQASLATDGRHVLFTSPSSDLPDPGRFNDTNIYLRDLLLGTTTRLTRPWQGGEFQDRLTLNIHAPKISGDGRYVAFASNNRELLPVDPAIDPLQTQVYLLDRTSGVLERISVTASGEPGNGLNEHVDISDDGRYLAFYSRSTNLPAGMQAVYVIDRLSGQWVNAAAELGPQISPFSTVNLDLASDGSAIAFSWRVADPTRPELYDRLLMYTVQLRGNPPPDAMAVPAHRDGWLPLLMALLLLLAMRHLASRSEDRRTSR